MCSYKTEFLCNSFAFYYTFDRCHFSELCNCTRTFSMFAIQLFKFHSKYNSIFTECVIWCLWRVFSLFIYVLFNLIIKPSSFFSYMLLQKDEYKILVLINNIFTFFINNLLLCSKEIFNGGSIKINWFSSKISVDVILYIIRIFSFLVTKKVL